MVKKNTVKRLTPHPQRKPRWKRVERVSDPHHRVNTNGKGKNMQGEKKEKVTRR